MFAWRLCMIFVKQVKNFVKRVSNHSSTITGLFPAHVQRTHLISDLFTCMQNALTTPFAASTSQCSMPPFIRVPCYWFPYMSWRLTNVYIHVTNVYVALLVHADNIMSVKSTVTVLDAHTILCRNILGAHNCSQDEYRKMMAALINHLPFAKRSRVGNNQ